jgi:hypothetical protein
MLVVEVQADSLQMDLGELVAVAEQVLQEQLVL